MDDANSSQQAFLAKLSVVLFAIGLLGPFFILGSTGSGDANKALIGAVGFGVASEVLALIFGLAARKHLCGTVGMLGGAAILTLCVVMLVIKIIVSS